MSDIRDEPLVELSILGVSCDSLASELLSGTTVPASDGNLNLVLMTPLVSDELKLLSGEVSEAGCE